MIHFNARFHQSSIQSKSNTNSQSGSAALSDEQIIGLNAPKKVNPLLWDLSSPQERRALMDSSAIAESDSNPPSLPLGSDSSTIHSLSKLAKGQYKILYYSKYTQASRQTDVKSNQVFRPDSQGTANDSQAEAKSQQSDQLALAEVTRQFKQRFRGTAENRSIFNEIMKKTFGDQYDQDKAETIRQQTLKGDFSWMPEIKLVNQGQLQDLSGTQTGGEALGAYSQSNDTVYLSKELVKTDPNHAEEILTEEVGHGIDTRVNVNDAKGDEGDIFSRQIHGESISTKTLETLQQENDSGVIEVNGQKIEVEYGFFSGLKKAVKSIGHGIKKAVKSVGHGIKKAVKSVGHGIKKAVKSVGHGIKKAVKSVGHGIKKAVKKIGHGIKKAFNKVMQSKIFQGLVTIAQFVPIPVVAMVAKGINVAMSAYNVYQGVKHKSWGMVLGGVAGVANGVSNLGKAFGASTGFIDTAANIAKHVNNASMTYKAIAEKDFLAAASLATNYFGGNSNINSAIQQVGKANQVYSAIKNDDYLGAIGVGSTLLQDFTGSRGDKILQTIGQNADLLRNVDQAVTNGDYSGAVSMLTQQYGDNLNLSSNERSKIVKVTQALKQVDQANQMLKAHDYAGAAQLLLQTAEQHTDSPESKQKLIEASQRVDQFNDVITAVKDGRYAESIAQAGDLMNMPMDQNSIKMLTDIQTYAEDAQKLETLIKNGASKKVIEIIKERMNEQVVITNILKHAA